ncbi:hypothetical protein J8L88_08170 [Aquimarina sp. MMG015]|uniref:hypothetical protein n=1 Tax=Aquimarina sp. MMG015 TaxID=2822689 RepID=UPI001B3A4895|nr:hypothetical protein [Aquimarina sp. MMG015]MBQ4802820.1 hypothetical protein [Aquimarina sp. MMG015]
MPVTQDINTQDNWKLSTKIIFRFFFVYLFLNIFPFPFYYIGLIPGLGNIFSFYYDGFEQLCLWSGKNILNITYEISMQPSGSGDTTADYVFQFVYLYIAVIATIIWSIIDLKRSNYNKLLLYTRTLVRYYLIATMFSYGFSKAFTLQFSELRNIDLIKPFGNQSPMGLMWNFMEYSDTYTKFSGYAEIIAGILLIFRKTTLLGSFMIIGVMFNVFMMNMSYDIPVKLYSALLTIMGLFLLAPDIKNILNFFVLNKTVNQKDIPQYFSKKKLQIAAISIKIIVIGYLFYTNIEGSIEGEKQWGKKAPKPALFGIYEVKEFIKNDDTLPPLTTDTIRWKRLIVDKRYSNIQTMDEMFIRLKEKTDSTSQTLNLISYSDSTDIRSFSYTKKDSIYTFEGTYKCDNLKIIAKKKEREEFLLINRGFHWINENPFNR